MKHLKGSLSLQQFQEKTDHFLSWIELRKMNGFLGSEINEVRTILEQCLVLDGLPETLDYITRQIRQEIHSRWNPTVLGRKYKSYQNNTPRAEVMQGFPVILREYLDTLVQVEAGALDEETLHIFGEIRERLTKSVEQLTLRATEKPEKPVERKKKSARTKKPRCDK